VGGFWYFYPQQIEGPPDYVSDVEVADDATAAPSPAAPAPTEESNYAVYYRPGDLTGTRYQTLEECLQAREQAGNVFARQTIAQLKSIVTISARDRYHFYTIPSARFYMFALGAFETASKIDSAAGISQ
jgi:hypothetical protein